MDITADWSAPVAEDRAEVAEDLQSTTHAIQYSAVWEITNSQ